MNNPQPAIEAVARIARAKFPPSQHGGCVLATRWLLENVESLTEEKCTVAHGDDGRITHVYAVMSDGRILDTQTQQFGLVLPIEFEDTTKDIFTREEHEKMLPRWRYEE